MHEYEPGTPHVTIGAELHLATPELDLSASGGRDQEPDLIVNAAVGKLAKNPEWEGIQDRVRRIRDEEIRIHVSGLIEDALTAGLRKTNTYGEPYGEPTTLRTLIGEEVRSALAKAADRYGSRESIVRKLVREEVDKALRKELSEAIAEEKAKVVAAVRGQAAELIAKAVTEGIGRA